MKNARLADVIQELKASATEAVDGAVKEMLGQGIDDIISLGVGEPSFDTPAYIKNAAVKALMDGETKYQPTKGIPALRQAICKKLERENKIKTNADQILVTAGGKFSIYLAFTAMLQKGDQIVLLDPAWVSYEAAAQMNAAEVIRVSSAASDGFLPDLDKVEQVLDDSVKIIVVNSPCNPSGAVFPMDTLRELAQMADKYGAILLSDEVYEYQIYDHKHYSPGADFDNIITVNAFSKSFAMTGWRLGYAVAPMDIVEGMTKIYTHSTSSVTSFAQWGAIAALESGESQKVVQEMQKEYTRNRSLMIELINKSAYLNLDCKPQGAFYCFPSYGFNMTSVELSTRLLRECHVATIPGVAFGQCGEGFLRLSYATDSQSIQAGMQRMEMFFQELESENRIGT